MLRSMLASAPPTRIADLPHLSPRGVVTQRHLRQRRQASTPRVWSDPTTGCPDAANSVSPLLANPAPFDFGCCLLHKTCLRGISATCRCRKPIRARITLPPAHDGGAGPQPRAAQRPGTTPVPERRLARACRHPATGDSGLRDSVGEVPLKDAAQVLLGQNDHVVQATAPSRSDHPIDVWVLPG